MPVLKTKVVGSQHREGALTRMNTLKHGHELRLARERKNQHDRAAVAVWDGDLQVGYIPKVDNRNLAIAMDQGIPVGAFVDERQPNLHVVYPYRASISPPDPDDLSDLLA